MLADPGRRDGAVVVVLRCGHARTTALSRLEQKGSAQMKDAKMWCHVCTELARAKKAAARAAAALEAMPAPAPTRPAHAPEPERITFTRAQFAALMDAVRGEGPRGADVIASVASLHPPPPEEPF